MDCPVCEGEGELRETFEEGKVFSYPCGYCQGTGEINFFRWLWFALWYKNL